MDFQTQTNWCWAAVSKSVASFFDKKSAWTQCSIANSALKGQPGAVKCCVKPVNSKCNIPWYLGKALGVVGAFSRRANKAESFSTVKGEVASKKPLCVRTGWTTGGGHFLAIIGWTETAAGVQYYEVTDPIYGRQTIKVSTFKSSYRGVGRWTHSYFVTDPTAGGGTMVMASATSIDAAMLGA